jgi:hypothetical protein
VRHELSRGINGGNAWPAEERLNRPPPGAVTVRNPGLGAQRDSDDAAIGSRHRLHDVADPRGGILDGAGPDGASCIDQRADSLVQEGMLADHRKGHRCPNRHETITDVNLL